MKAMPGTGATAAIAQWASEYRLEEAPPEVVERMKVLILDLLRVVAVGARMPWSRAARRLAVELGGNPECSILLYSDRIDAARAAFANGVFAHAIDLDDTHVGSMLHPGASVLPAALAASQLADASGPELLAAAICGYEVGLRTGLAVQPSQFHRGFMATPTCGTLGAAVAVGKLLGMDAEGLAGTLGVAASYSGGLAQFYKSGSTVKRINAARAAESGVVAALLVQRGIYGPRDILEGEAGFFRAFSDQYDPGKVVDDLGESYRLMEVSNKIHAGAGRLQATADAGLALGSKHGLLPGQIVDVEVGIPRVIQGRLTQAAPPDLQSAQMSVPFALALALAQGRRRGAEAALRREDYEAGMADPEIRELSRRVRCVADPEIEASSGTEEVPSRVTLRLADGRILSTRVDHPRGSPHRRLLWGETRTLFRDALDGALSPERMELIPDLVLRLDSDARPGDLVSAFVADPSWLQ